MLLDSVSLGWGKRMDYEFVEDHTIVGALLGASGSGSA
jgi:hypothetical protein